MKKIFLFFLMLPTLIYAKAEAGSYSLSFNPDRYSIQSFTKDNKEYKIRAFENIVYVANPIDTTYQKLNIYVPDEYFSGAAINGYTLRTAPIFLPNAIGGYMPALPMSLDDSENPYGMHPGGVAVQLPTPPPGADMKQESAIQYALSRGYVVVSPGARGRSLKDSAGVYTGKAPAGLVDLKAAVCYLRYNDQSIPGDKSKIISNGTSAGGAMSLLLGATGNSEDYKPYLEELGAADVPDAIFAVSAYCPITDLNHADCAYEWQFNGINTYEARMMDFISGIKPGKDVPTQLTTSQIETSNQLKTLFPLYLNSLGLKDDNGSLLLLDAQGNGNFKEFVKSYVIASAQIAMDKGKDLSEIKWLTIENKKVTGIDFEAYIRNMKRMKTPPAFDAFDLSTPETHLFGTASIDAQHFTRFSYDNAPEKRTIADQKIINMMNPLHYIGTSEATTAGSWHIRYGSIDNNTSLAIEVIVATFLKNKGYEVDFAIAWDRPHMGDYDLDELFDWIDNCIRKDAK